MNDDLRVLRLRSRRQIKRLRSMLVEANDAFDDCTGDYQKELVEGEAWRAVRSPP